MRKAEGWHQISHLKHNTFPSHLSCNASWEIYNLLGGNGVSLPWLTGSQCQDPVGDLNPPDRGPNLSDNCQFMLMAAKDTEVFLHRGALTIKAEGGFSMSSIAPCIHAVERAGTPWLWEGEIPYIPTHATHWLAPSDSSSCCVPHGGGEFGQQSRKKDLRRIKALPLHMSQTHHRAHTALKHCLRCWERCSKVS